MSCPRVLLPLFAFCLSTLGAWAVDVTADQIQASFATTWTKAQYIQAAKDYYTAKHPNWNAYVTTLSAGGNRFAGAEVKPCAALYRETGDTKYSDAIRAFLVGTINNNKMDYAQEMDFNYSYIQVRYSPSVSAADRTLIENFISQRMDWLMTQDDDTTFVRGMINCTALAYAERVILPADPHAATWRAWHQAKWNLGMARIGDAVENSSNYAPMWFQGLYEYLRLTGADLEAYYNQPSVRNFCERTLQLVSSLGYVPTYGGTTDFTKLGGRPGMYEAMATLYRDGRYKTASQRILNFQRVVVDPYWFGPVDDICAFPIFDYVDDTVTPEPFTRPAVSTHTRTFIDKTCPDKLVMAGGDDAGDSYVLMDFAQGFNHGIAGGSALVSFVDKASPLLVNASKGDRVYQNLLMVRSTSEAFPFVPAAAGQPGQQYVFDNVRRRHVFNIKGPEATNGGVPDPATLSKLTFYLTGTTSISGTSTVHLYFDDIKAVGTSGTLTLRSGTTTILNPSNWFDLSFGGARDLSAYDTVEFGMRIEMVTPGAITDVMSLLQTGTSGGYHFRQDFDTCSLGKTKDAQSFAKMQFASTEMQLKDTLGGDNIQQRDILLAPGGILLVRDRVTFPAAENNVQMGPVWNAAQLLSSGANWYDLRQAKAHSLPQRQLLTLFPPRTDSGITFTTGTAKDPNSTAVIACQKWTGSASAGNTRTFNSLLMGHGTGSSANTLAATVQTLECDETATVLKIGGNYLVINPNGASLNAGGLQTDAKSLYLETGGTTPYFAGTQGSSVICGGTALFSSGTTQPRFGSLAPVLKVPANITVYAPTTGGAVVNFTAEAYDNTDGVLTPVCTPPSGSVFPPGVTTVTCSATNSLGQIASGTFTVTVYVSNLWTNSAASSWNTATNWSLGRAPNATDPVFLTTAGQSFTTVPQITVGTTTAGTLTIDSPTVSNVINYGGSTPQVMSIYGLGTEPLISISGSASSTVSVNKVNFRPRVSGAVFIEAGKTFNLFNTYFSESSAGTKLTKTGGGTVSFGGSGFPKVTFTGGLDMAEGVWDASLNSTCLPTIGVINFINPPGTTAAIQADQAHSIEALAGGNDDSSIYASSLTITGNRATTFGGKITGSTNLNITGSGSLTLTNANTFTGTTTVSSGSFVLSGSLTGALIISSGGSFLPEGSPTINGNVTMSSGATMRVHLNNSTPGAGYDQLTAKAGVSLDGALDIIAAPGLIPGTTFTILNKTSAGAISGTFSGKPEGSVFASGGNNWLITYVGGTGNDLILTLVSGLAAWRWSYFGTTTDTGIAADSADANKDGETNFFEFATGQNPNATTTATPTLVKTGTDLEYTYTRSDGAIAAGVTFVVEWSDTLAANSWSSSGVSETILTDNGTVQTVKATIPAGSGPKRFVRLRITN